MTDSVEIHVERRIKASPAAVYRHLRDSVEWARWQGESAQIEPIAGGVFRLVMRGGATVEGRFIELVPDQRVVFTWGWRGSPSVPPGASTVDIELVADGDETIVKVTHRGLPAEDVGSTGSAGTCTCRAWRSWPREATPVRSPAAAEVTRRR